MTKQSKSEAFLAAATAPDPRYLLMIDQILAGLDDNAAGVIREVLLDRSWSSTRCQTGFAAMGVKVSVSAVDNWRRLNV